MTMFTMPPRQVLAATDLSAQAGLAIQRAAQLVAQHGAQLTALHVVPPRLDPELTEFAQSRLDAQVHQYAAVAAETVLRAGKAGAEIVAEADHRAADLLVVGAHTAHWLADPFLGSTAENVVRASQAPVLVVKKPPDTAYRSVLLTVDTSETSAAAARAASALTPEADHVVVHVHVVIGEHLMQMRGIDEVELAQLCRVSSDQVRPRVEELAAALTPRPTQVVIESGRPQSVLPDLVDHYEPDLIVVGTGERSKLGYALLGSVALHVMRQAKSDVLVIRGPEK